MRVLGVDPGTIITGWGVIDVNGSRITRVASGTLSVGRGELPSRLAEIHRGIGDILAEHEPEAAGLERNFVSRNVQSAFRIGEARGVIIAAVASFGVPLTEYTPATVKKAVVGHGRADKNQVQDAVVRLLRLQDHPAVDEADALAVAACYALRSGYDEKISTALGRVGPARPLARKKSRGLADVAKAAMQGRTKARRRET